MQRLILGLCFFLMTSVAGHAIETTASHAVILDHKTGVVLYDKQAHEPMYPASMTKMMTAYMMFEALRSGELSVEDTYPVSEKAWRKGGSKMFVRLEVPVSIANLMKGIVIQSGNDACIVFAEGYAGSEDRFAQRMTLKAKEIGMQHTVFKNSTGWPDEAHVTTAYDLAVLSRRTVMDFPEYYPIYAQMEYTYNDIRQHNRNVLLARDIGVDGLKTGHTEAAGYGITISGEQDERRVHVVVNGLGSEKERAREAAKLYRYAYAEFAHRILGEANTPLSELPVWYGASDTVPIQVMGETMIVLPTVETGGIKAHITYDAPLKAPIDAGQVVGVMTVSAGGMSDQTVEIIATQPVAEASFFKRLMTNAKHLLFGT